MGITSYPTQRHQLLPLKLRVAATGAAKNKLQLHSLDINALRVPIMIVTWNRVKKSMIPDTCLVACKLGERYSGILIPLTWAYLRQQSVSYD